MGYTVPNFGPVDSDIAASLSHMSAIEKSMDDADWIPAEPAKIPRDYPVVNLGMDRDVSDTIMNSAVAEGLAKHKWKWDASKYLNPARHNAVAPYYDEGSVLEDDIKVSQKNLAESEKNLDIHMELP